MNISIKCVLLSRFCCYPQLVRSFCYRIIKRPDFSKLKIPSNVKGPGVLEILRDKIKISGPLTVADYFNIVVTNPSEGYYVKKELIGQGGDFITSPEISQLFGEAIGVWFYSEYKKMGCPKPLQIVELGPGKGTLLVDMLRTITRLGMPPKDISLHLVEISPTLQTIQANRLCLSHQSSNEKKLHYHKGETLDGSEVLWYQDLSQVRKGFSWYIAHEFFDALPIHKFQKTEDGWREILVDVDEDGNFCFKVSSKPTTASKLYVRPPVDARDTDQLEISPRSLSIANDISRRVDKNGGIALIADYGHFGEKGDTFRGFHRHELVDPLKMPGKCDLTADVDFEQIKMAAESGGSIVYGPIEQRKFLEDAGATVRLEALRQSSTTRGADILKHNYDMLTNPQVMGSRFKFMAMFPDSMKAIHDKFPPTGFQNT